MTKTFTLLTLATFQIFSAVNDFHTVLPNPVHIPVVEVKENIRLTRTKQTLTLLNRDVKHADNVFLSATAVGIDPVLFAVLLETESEFKMTAKSNKGYKGFAQTPDAVMKTGYELADMTYGACVLREKLNMKYSNGDMLFALQLYKGGRNNEALKYAKQVMAKYEKIKNKLDKERV